LPKTSQRLSFPNAFSAALSVRYMLYADEAGKFSLGFLKMNQRSKISPLSGESNYQMIMQI